MNARWLMLALVGCAPPRDGHVANHAVPTAGHESRELWFPRTDAASEEVPDLVSVSLTLAPRGKSIATTVFSYRSGRITQVAFELASPLTGGYQVNMHERREDDGDYGLAVVIPALPGMRGVRVAADDIAKISSLTGNGIANVEAVRGYGLDLDGDGRADLAFADVCGERLDDGMCEGRNDVLVRRLAETWWHASMCNLTVNCWAF